MIKNKFLLALFIAAVAVFAGVTAVLAHQPRLVVSNETAVVEPEISKAYYGELTGAPAVFAFKAVQPFDLYAGLLVPDRPGVRTDLVLEISRDGLPVANLSAPFTDWKKMHEPFAGDDYLQGPEYRLAQAAAGSYDIKVAGPDNRGRYILAVGEAESFPLSETLGALQVIPELKSEFFGKPRITFLFSVFGGIEMALALVLGVIAGIAWRLSLRSFPKSRPGSRRNIGRPDRLVRLALAAGLLAVGLVVWSPLFTAAAGFVLFEAAAGWCALYAAMGRNTCPIS